MNQFGGVLRLSQGSRKVLRLMALEGPGGCAGTGRDVAEWFPGDEGFVDILTVGSIADRGSAGH